MCYQEMIIFLILVSSPFLTLPLLSIPFLYFPFVLWIVYIFIDLADSLGMKRARGRE